MSVVDGLPFTEQKKKYILTKLDPILEEMVGSVLTELPKEPLPYMIEWLRKRSGAGPATRCSMLQMNTMLKKELQTVTNALEETSMAINDGAGGDAGAENEEEDEDDDCGDEIPESFRKPEAQMGRARASVSAEAYGNWNQKKAFEAPSYAKTDDQKERLRKIMASSFMFAALESGDMETVIMAVKEVNYPAGAKVITEGDNGEFMFVIEKGVLECLKNIDGQDKVVKTCQPGDVFGELALLYNCPRGATCVAKEPLVAWQLDRESFNNIVKEAAVKQRARYDAFLKSVTLISGLSPAERSQIADALKVERFRKDEVVVTQDEPGDKFYIVEEGQLFARKTFPGEGDKRVMDYGPADCFGELALLKNQPRAASVIVSSDSAKVLSMTRQAFNKMLGPLQAILQRHTESYC